MYVVFNGTRANVLSIAYLGNDLWFKNATHSNSMAKILAEKASRLGVKITQQVDANGVFAILDDQIGDQLKKEYFFYP